MLAAHPAASPVADAEAHTVNLRTEAAFAAGVLLPVTVMVGAMQLLDSETPAPPPSSQALDDVPFVLHFPDPDLPGDLRLERWVCDIEVVTDDTQIPTAHADCEEP